MLKKLDSPLKDLDEDNNIVLNDPIVGNYILSLRYNPHQHTELSKLNWKDFTPSTNNVSTNFLEKTLQKSTNDQGLANLVDDFCKEFKRIIDKDIA